MSKEAASEHTALLQAIHEVDYASPTLNQVKENLDWVQKELNKEKKSVTELEASTKKEFKEWQAIKERTASRLWVKIQHPRSNKTVLSEKESKEEKEYVQAFGLEQSARSRVQELERQVGSLQGDITRLEPIAAQHQHLQKLLDELYSRVFSGPTPSFPNEDFAEIAYGTASEEFNRIQGAVTNEQRALGLLQEANMLMKRAAQSASEAEQASTWDMWGGGGMADMMERNALSEAQRSADQARIMVMQAQRLQPMIGDLQSVQMPQGNLMGDIFFDNIFSDMAFHEKIQRAALNLNKVHASLLNIVGQSKTHLEGLQLQLKGAGRELEDARGRLQSVRQGILEGVASGKIAADVPPPSYS